MSKLANSRWELGAQMKRQAYLDRVRENAANFRNRYETKLGDLVSQGLEKYMPREFAEVRRNLNRLDKLISSDPESARDLSFQIGQELSRLPAMARAARNEFEERERQRRKELEEMRKKAATELSRFIHDAISDIKDPVEMDFAFDDIRAIELAYQGRKIEPGELEGLKTSILRRVSEIRKSAQTKAETWKRERVKLTAKEASTALVGIYQEQANTEVAWNPKGFQDMLSDLEEIKLLADRAIDPEEIRKRVEDVARKADKSVAEENCRRIVVRSIMDSLEKSGFVVSKPKRSAGEIDEVVILARKPAGAEASFKVNADGGLIYKFDHYEGMKCKDDIDTVFHLLKDVYGVNLSQERILWQNPDRISRSARPLEGDIRGRENG